VELVTYTIDGLDLPMAFPFSVFTVVSSEEPDTSLAWLANYSSCSPSGCDEIIANGGVFLGTCLCTNETLWSFYNAISTLGVNPGLVLSNETVNATVLQADTIPVSKYGLGLSDSLLVNENLPENLQRRRPKGLARDSDLTYVCTVNYRLGFPANNNLTLYYMSPPDVTWVAFVRKETFNYNFDCNGAICSFELPPDIYQTEGTLYVDILLVPTICASLVIQLDGAALCRPHDCTWSCFLEMIQYYHCLPSGLQAGVWIVFALILLLCICAFPTFILFICYEIARHTVNCPFYIYDAGVLIVASPLSKGLGKHLVRGWRYSKYMLTGAETEDLEAAMPKGKALAQINRRVPATKKEAVDSFKKTLQQEPPSFWRWLLICLHLQAASGMPFESPPSLLIPDDVTCAFTQTVSSTATNCEGTGASQICNFYLTGSFSINMGMTSCISVVDSAGNPFALLAFHYQSNIATVSASKSYNTANWAYKEANLAFCPNTLNFQQCLDWAATGYPDRFYSILSPYNTQPGFNNCMQNNANGACGDKKWSYNLYRSAILPTGHEYTVYQMQYISYVPKLVVSVIDSQNYGGAQTISISQGVGVSDDGTFQITLDGLYNVDPTIFPTPYYTVDITNGSIGYLPLQASARGTPSKGFGEIQSNTDGAIFSSSLSAFIFDPSILTCSSSSTTYHCQSLTQHGVPNMLATSIPLPARIGGNYWYLNSRTLMSNLTVAPPIQVTFSALGEGLSLHSYYAQVCPQISTINATGCYSCDEQAILTVTVQSTCAPGISVMKFSDPEIILGNPVLAIQVTPEIWEIRFTTQKSVNHFLVTLCDSSGANCASDDVSFIAFEKIYQDVKFNNGTTPEAIEGYSPTHYNSNISPKHWTDAFGVLGDFFANVFNGVAPWWQTFIMAILGIVIFFAALALIRWLNSITPKDAMDRVWRPMVSLNDKKQI
jgi:hypothetical protein